MRTSANKQKPTEEAKSTSTTKPARAFSEQSLNRNFILHLQQTLGNQTVQRLLQPTLEDPKASATSGLMHDFSGSSVHASARNNIQLKLNAPGDRDEQEADRVAEQVMHMPGPGLQRQVDEEQGEELLQTKPLVQRQVAGDRGVNEAPPIVHEVLRSPGQPLDDKTRAFMKPRFGQDFSQVRVHADAKAAESARAVDALAYTVGRNVVFAAGQYAPGTVTGRSLLAHELTHIIQQAAPDGNSHSQDGRLHFYSGVVQRRNGGFRPPPRPPRRPVRGERGPYGQLPGQRMPRTTRARREAFERRERERVEAARRKFEETVKRSQEQLERWAKEGSEPKTPRERAIRAILKFWELWDDLSTSWDKTHESFQNMLIKRANLEEQGHGSKRVFAEIDQDIMKISRALQDLDSELFEHIIRWEAQVYEWSEWRGGVDWLDPQSVIAAAIHLVSLLFDFMKISDKIEKKCRQIEHAISVLDGRLSLLLPWTPPPTTIRETD